jgi:hypothetical protein
MAGATVYAPVGESHSIQAKRAAGVKDERCDGPCQCLSYRVGGLKYVGAVCWRNLCIECGGACQLTLLLRESF